MQLPMLYLKIYHVLQAKNVITINGLPQWGFYTVIAPPNVYIDQGGIVFDN